MIAGAADDRIVPANLTFVRVQRPKESDGAVASLNFKGHRRKLRLSTFDRAESCQQKAAKLTAATKPRPAVCALVASSFQ
jgi:hypothetical protein